MIDITQIIGSTWYEIVTKTDGTQIVMYSPIWIANAVLTILMFWGFFSIVLTFQKVWSKRGDK